MHWNFITFATNRQLVEETLDKIVHTNEKAKKEKEKNKKQIQIRGEIDHFLPPSLILVRLRARRKVHSDTHTATNLNRTPNNIIIINNADLKQIN